MQSATAGKPQTQEATNAKKDLRLELSTFEESLEALRVLYEQYFLGLVPLSPDREARDVKRRLRELMKAPFKNSAMTYKLKMLVSRYHTLNTYWQRVLKAREDGTYCKDVFKANLRERRALEEAYAQTAQGAAERGMQQLFQSYREALEKQTGAVQRLNFEAFSKSLVERAKEFKARHQCKKVAFKVVVKEGKVTILASGK